MDIANLGGPADPFALGALDEALEGDGKVKKSKKKKEAEAELESSGGDLVHIRVQQRNGRKCITTVQGLDQALDLKKILKTLKKSNNCNGTVVEDDDMGQVIQLQGDQRTEVEKFLTDMEIVEKSKIKKHGAG